MNIITPEFLTSLGYTSKVYDLNKAINVFFYYDKESWLCVDFKQDFVSANKYVNDRVKEVYRGTIDSEEDLLKIIKDLK